jgi:hypothetical protein
MSNIITAEKIRGVLETHLRESDGFLITYGELAKRYNAEYGHKTVARNFAHGLDALNRQTLRENGYALSSIVVNIAFGTPGDGYFACLGIPELSEQGKLLAWLAQLEKIVRAYKN